MATSPSLHWPVYIFTNVPTASYEALGRGQSMHRLHNASVLSAARDSDLESDERLAMVFEASFCGDYDGRGGDRGQPTSPINILFDTGASSNFVNPGLLQKLGISFAPSSATLRLADDSSAPVLGKI